MYCSHCKRELALRTFSKNKVGKRLKNCKRCNKHRREITKKWKEPFRQNIKCFKCKKEIDPAQVKKRVICPYCGFRIIKKTRPETVKKVRAK